MRKFHNTSPHLVLFLGAGASAFAEYRTFAGFAELLFDPALRYHERLPALDSLTVLILEEILNSLKAKGIAQTHDNFLWALGDYRPFARILRVDTVLRSRFARNTEQQQSLMSFTEAVDKATDQITLTTVRHYGGNRLQATIDTCSRFLQCKNVYTFYKSLAARNNSRQPFLPTFTTNYDMLIEDMIERFAGRNNDTVFINGIPSVRTEGSEWNAGLYSTKPNNHFNLHLYRLHGCVCWFYNRSGAVYFARRENHSVKSSDLTLVYPGSTSHLGATPHSLGFRRLFNMTVSANIFIAIGYSFRDDDVNQLIATAIFHRQRPLKLLVVDPMLQSQDVRDRIVQSVRRTPLPMIVPDLKDISCVNAHFGVAGFENHINESLEVMEHELE